MPKWRSLGIWLLATAALVALLLLTPDQQPELSGTDLGLPENPPDIFVQGMQLTRYDSAGQPIMKTEADSLAVYNDTGLSHLQAPVITLLQDSNEAWQITAQTAVIHQNDTIDFQRTVRTVQLNTNTPVEMRTETLQVSESGNRISTDAAVVFTQGNQRMTGTGMLTEITDQNATINLLSDVSFLYDPS